MKTQVSVLIGGTLRLEVLKGLIPGDGIPPVGATIFNTTGNSMLPANQVLGFSAFGADLDTRLIALGY